MGKIDAVIFDADGTLLDTREFIFQAFERTLDAHGHAIPPRDVFTSSMGLHLIDMYKTFAPDGDVATLVEHHRELHREELLYLLAGYEGLHELLSHIRAQGMRLGVCTNREHGVEDLLKRVGIFNDFETIVTGGDVKNLKPDPEGLLRALANLDCVPERAVMVGDASVDIGAGRAAGVAFTIGVTHGFGAEGELLEAGADYIAHHLNEIPGILEKHT